MKPILFSLLAFSISVPAFAHHIKGHEGGACHQIVQACESAGYKKGGHNEGKGLFKDCMIKIRKGESVPGVSVSKEQVDACQKQFAHRRGKPMGHRDAASTGSGE